MVGVDAKNRTTLDPKYICPQCLLILRHPVQLNGCGHRMCHSCCDTQLGTTIIYPECKLETPHREVMVDLGFKSDMQSLSIDCFFCQWTGDLKTYQKHLDHFHPNPKCERCGEQFSSVNELNEHTVSQCQGFLVDCVLKLFGCNEQIICSKMKEHYLTEQHQDNILKIIRRLRSQLLDTQIDTNLLSTDNSSGTDQLPEIRDMLNILASGGKILDDTGQHLSDESFQNQIQSQILAENFSQVKLSIEESNTYLMEMEHNLDGLKKQIVLIKEKINDRQCISYDGILVWKITNFQEKMTDAQSERQISIFSPPFYSSPTGYKMRARLYLYGDGNARRTHMSLFFVLMRGLNDPILKFPFNYKVTFCMYDQSPARRHIIDSFRPDIRSNSFQRARSDMNIASGIPKFFPLEMIQQAGNPYVRDDTMFIKIMVDFSGMPETLLPYALSLNPGIPTQIQQAMIIQELEQRIRESSASTEGPDDT